MSVTVFVLCRLGRHPTGPVPAQCWLLLTSAQLLTLLYPSPLSQTEEDTSREDRVDTEEDTAEDTSRVPPEVTASSSSTAPPRASTVPSREVTSAEPPTASSSRADRARTARDSREVTKRSNGNSKLAWVTV